jgi:hypothetical protein
MVRLVGPQLLNFWGMTVIPTRRPAVGKGRCVGGGTGVWGGLSGGAGGGQLAAGAWGLAFVGTGVATAVFVAVGIAVGKTIVGIIIWDVVMAAGAGKAAGIGVVTSSIS